MVACATLIFQNRVQRYYEKCSLERTHKKKDVPKRHFFALLFIRLPRALGSINQPNRSVNWLQKSVLLCASKYFLNFLSKRTGMRKSELIHQPKRPKRYDLIRCILYLVAHDKSVRHFRYLFLAFLLASDLKRVFSHAEITHARRYHIMRHM